MLQGRRILVADDDFQIQRALKRAGADSGYDVTSVTSANDLLDEAIGKMPELIVLDVSFPDADGRDLLAMLKADARTSKIPVLIWSGATRDPESDRKIALSLGAEDYVEKIDVSTLLRKIQRVFLRLDAER